MKDMGMDLSLIRAGNANMFLSPLFRTLIANLTGAPVNLYNTDGSLGAARGAGVGCRYYSGLDEAFVNLEMVSETIPSAELLDKYENLYQQWKHQLNKNLQTKVQK
jgi:xylulokinase